jgi:hypothetical protein
MVPLMNPYARRVLAAAACAVLLASVVPSAQSAVTPPQRPPEYQVKAEYIYGFTQYIEWPSSTWADADAPFRICIAGADPFGALMDRVVKGEKTQGHPFLVDRLAADADLARCQIVFLGSEETARPSAVLKALSSTSTLTIGESRQFLDAGGAVALVMDSGRVRFDVNLRSAQIKDLRFSSKVLRLARDIWRVGSPP